MNIEQISKEAASPGVRCRETISLEEFATIGTFAGSKDVILRVRDGMPVAANTGDQGGGQN